MPLKHPRGVQPAVVGTSDLGVALRRWARPESTSASLRRASAHPGAQGSPSSVTAPRYRTAHDQQHRASRSAPSRTETPRAHGRRDLGLSRSQLAPQRRRPTHAGPAPPRSPRRALRPAIRTTGSPCEALEEPSALAHCLSPIRPGGRGRTLRHDSCIAQHDQAGPEGSPLCRVAPGALRDSITSCSTTGVTRPAFGSSGSRCRCAPIARGFAVERHGTQCLRAFAHHSRGVPCRWRTRAGSLGCRWAAL